MITAKTASACPEDMLRTAWIAVAMVRVFIRTQQNYVRLIVAIAETESVACMKPARTAEAVPRTASQPAATANARVVRASSPASWIAVAAGTTSVGLASLSTPVPATVLRVVAMDNANPVKAP
jgi:hypothetical protein